MNLALLEILMLSALGGFIISQLPSVKAILAVMNKRNLDVSEVKEGTSVENLSKSGSVFRKLKTEWIETLTWPLATLSLYLFLIFTKPIDTAGEHIIAMINGAVISLIAILVIPLLIQISWDLVKDRSALLGLLIITVPGILIAFFQDNDYVVFAGILVYIFLAGLWLKESAGWVGVLFTVGSIFFILYLGTFF